MTKRARLERRRAAAATRREQQRRRRRQRLAWAGAAIGAVVVVLASLVVVRIAGAGSSGEAQQSSDPASAAVVAAVTTVPGSVLDRVGVGKVDALPKQLTGQPPLVTDGKPLVLYVGAEYCPFCAVQRWGLVVALSRFGSFSGLRTTHSSAEDVYPNTATLSFHGATYTSQYVVFEGVETQSNEREGGSYAALDSLTAKQASLLQTYNAPPYVPAQSAGSIPFLDFGNKYLVSGASISPQLLAEKSASDIAHALSDPADPIALAVDGSANAFTAMICDLTEGLPATVCGSAAATSYLGRIHAG